MHTGTHTDQDAVTGQSPASPARSTDAPAGPGQAVGSPTQVSVHRERSGKYRRVIAAAAVMAVLVGVVAYAVVRDIRREAAMQKMRSRVPVPLGFVVDYQKVLRISFPDRREWRVLQDGTGWEERFGNGQTTVYDHVGPAEIDGRPGQAVRRRAEKGLADDFEIFIPDDGSNLWFRVGREKEWNVFGPMESVEWSAVPATVNERSRNSIRWP